MVKDVPKRSQITNRTGHPTSLVFHVFVLDFSYLDCAPTGASVYACGYAGTSEPRTGIRSSSFAPASPLIKSQYDQFFTDAFTLDNVEVVLIHGVNSPITAQGDLFPQNVTLTIRGDRTQI